MSSAVTAMSTTWRFDEGQYVFGFREFIIPVASVFFYNRADQRTTGKFLGLTGARAVKSNRAGAFITQKSRVDYDAGPHPV